MDSLAILVAMRAEMEIVINKLADREEHSIRGLQFVSGLMCGKPCLVALMGMGKVNAAAATALLIEHCEPRGVICAGVGGGLNPDLRCGDIVIAEQAAHHDYGHLRSAGFQIWPTRDTMRRLPNPLFMPADPGLLQIAEAASRRLELPQPERGDAKRPARIVKGRLVTGDTLVTAPSKRKELWETYQADAVDMEGAAVSQVCRRLKVAHLIVRGISDVEEENVADEDWQASLKIAIQNVTELAALVVSGAG